MRRATNILLITLLLTFAVPVRGTAEEISPGIQVYIGEVGETKASLSMGDSHRMILQCTLPGEIRDCTVVQTLPPGLVFEGESVIVQFLPERGDPSLLKLEEDYTLVSGSVYVEGGTGDRISLTLTQAGSEHVRSGGELRIFYDAVLDETAPIGTQILLYAQMTCVFSSGQREIFLSDQASVYTGGLRLVLTDPENVPQPGARFLVARAATQEEIGDPSVPKEHLDVEGTPTAVVYVCFYTAPGQRVSVMETDERGEARCYGLPFGSYYLVRGDVPAVPVRAVIDEGSYLTRADGWRDSLGREIDNALRIQGPGTQLPATGGPGVLGYVLSGWGVILSACVLLWTNRKKNPVYALARERPGLPPRGEAVSGPGGDD